MSFSVNPINASNVSLQTVSNNKEVGKSEEKKSNTTKKVVASAIGLTSVIALGILALKKKKVKSNQIKSNNPKPPEDKKVTRDIKKQAEKSIVNTKKVSEMTDAEKEAFIKEKQSQTDIPEAKDEIRKLVENGEWDNL